MAFEQRARLFENVQYLGGGGIHPENRKRMNCKGNEGRIREGMQPAMRIHEYLKPTAALSLSLTPGVFAAISSLWQTAK